MDRWMDTVVCIPQHLTKREMQQKGNVLLFKSDTWGCVRNIFFIFYLVTSYILLTCYHENNKNFQTLQQSGCLEDDTDMHKHTPTTPTESHSRPAVVLRDLRVLGEIMSSLLWPQGTAGNYHDPCSCSVGIHFPLRFSGTEKEDLRRVQAFFYSDIWIQGGPHIQSNTSVAK